MHSGFAHSFAHIYKDAFSYLWIQKQGTVKRYTRHSNAVHTARKSGIVVMTYHMKSLSLLSMLLLIVSCSSSKPGIDQPTVETLESDGALVEAGSCSSTATISSVTSPTEIPADSETSDQSETTPDAEPERDTGCGGPLDTAVNEPGSLPTGTGTINLLGTDLLVDGAAVEVLENGNQPNNSSIDLIIHNGEIRILEQRSETQHGIYWGVYSGSLLISVELVSSASDQFEVGTFEFIDVDGSNDTALTGVDALVFGSVSYDSDSSGKIDSQDEVMLVVGGNINITGSRPDWSITLDLSLSNGERLTGQFDGDYIDIPVFDTL